MEQKMSNKVSEFFAKREKPVVGKFSIPDEVILNCPFVLKKLEQAKRHLEEHPFPVELLRSR